MTLVTSFWIWAEYVIIGRPFEPSSDVITHDDGLFVGMSDVYDNDMEILCRNSCDDVINQFGERLCEMCRMCGMRIVNGRKIGDSTGKRTCYE